MQHPLLSIEHYSQVFSEAGQEKQAVAPLSLQIAQGEIFGLVGESGSGKSTIARAVMGFLRPTTGRILFQGQNLDTLPPSKQRRIQMIVQDAAAALNPRMLIKDILAEPFDIHGILKGKERTAKLSGLLESVALDPRLLDALPSELSGGQRQRVCIARALAVQPLLLLADEPVASLDVSTQAHIIHLFQSLRATTQLSLLFIAHDLALVRYLCDRVAVLWQGRLVELAPTEDLFRRPQHAYTKALLSAMLTPDPCYERHRTVYPLPSPPQTHGVFQESFPQHWVWCASVSN